MMKRRTLMITTLAGWLGMASVASKVLARPVNVLSLDEQLQQAKLVVIATAIATRDKVEVKLDGTEDQTTPILTDFKVESVIRGTWPMDNDRRIITLSHLRYVRQSAEISVVDGPTFVEFNPALKNRYLMYLKLGTEGRYEPVSGLYDPTFSFYELKPYHIAEERKTVPPG